MKLTLIRKKINQIDSQLIKLLKKRSLLIPKVKRIKRNWSYKIAFKREFSMAQDLTTKDFGLYPITYMQKIWRELISATLYIECKLQIHILNTKQQPENLNFGLWEITKDHFGSYSNLKTHDNIKNLWEYLNEGKTECLVFPLHSETQDKWWLYFLQEKYQGCTINLELPYLKSIKTLHKINGLCVSKNTNDVSNIRFYIIKTPTSLSHIDNITILDKNNEYIFIKTKQTIINLKQQLQLTSTDILFVGSTPVALDT